MGPFPWSETLGEWLAPRKVAPVVGWLAHDSCPANGECFTVGAGHVARVSIVATEGFIDRDLTIDSVAEHAERDHARSDQRGDPVPVERVRPHVRGLPGLGRLAGLRPIRLDRCGG